MKNFIAALLMCVSIFAAADMIGILKPSGNSGLTPLEKQRCDDASANLQRFLQTSGIECGCLSGDDVKTGKAKLSKYKTLLVLFLEPLTENVWKALEEYVNNGGNIIWQGTKIRNNPITELDRACFKSIAGTEVKDYVCDPTLGVSLINKYMWIRPVEGGAVFPANGRKFYAVFAGEAVEIAPAGSGKLAGEWLERDKKTVDGAAVISNCAGKGGTVFFSNYPLLLAGQKNDQPPVKHAAYMLADALAFLGHKHIQKVSHLSKNETRPLNWTPIKTESPRAMWVWKNSCALNPKEREQLFKFCRLRKINTLYLYTGPSFFKDKTKVAAVREFLLQAHELGIKVHALDGWPDAVETENQDKFLASLMSVLAYNSVALEPGERFDGFQSDVEPGVLKSYHKSLDSRNKTDLNFIQLHDKCRKLIDMIQKGKKDFEFGLAISEQYDREDKNKKVVWNGKKARVSDHMMNIVDYLAVMSYHDLADETIEEAEYEVELAKKAGKKTWVGAETLDIASEYKGSRAITFYEEGLEEMEKQLKTVEKKFKGNPGFGGVAIHCYRSYRRMPDKASWKEIKGAPPEMKAEKLDAVKLDGRADEWKGKYAVRLVKPENVVYGRDNWKGADDLSAKAYLGYDKANIYLYAEVRDDRHVFWDSASDMWKGDHLEMWLNSPGSELVLQLGFQPGDFNAEKPSAYIWHPKKLDKNVREHLIKKIELAATKIDGGYALEAKIPATVFGRVSLEKGLELRLAVNAGDTDDKENLHKVLMSSSPVLSKKRPHTFGKLVLE